MRKLLLLVAMIALVFTSCEKDAQVIGTGTLNIKAVVENSGDEKKTNIERGDVPVYVKGLNITVAEKSANSEQFLFVGAPTGLAHGEIQITDVPNTGNINLTATSIPADGSDRDILVFKTNRGNLEYTDDTAGVNRQKVLNVIKAKYAGNYDMTPYAVYTGDATHTMIKGGPNNIPVNMHTVYGRDFGSIVNDSEYKVTVDLKVDGDWLNTMEIESDKAISYYWSNITAIAGAQNLFMKFKWYDSYGNLVREAGNWRIITNANESYWARISVTGNGVVEETTSSMFTFDPIDEVGGDTVIN